MAERIKRGDRKDGVWLKDLDPLHGFMPYLYPNRADNEAFIQEQIDITALNEYLKKKTEGDPEFKYTYLHAIVAALVRTITLRPKMNRFISGNRIYQRRWITAAFMVKRQFADESSESIFYKAFGDDDNIDTIHRSIKERAAEAAEKAGVGKVAATTSKIYLSRLSRAFAIILGAAATTIVAMLPLLYMGFGALTGFALIIIIGVVLGTLVARPAYGRIIGYILGTH